MWWYWHTSSTARLPALHHSIAVPVSVIGLLPSIAGHAVARQHVKLVDAHPCRDVASLQTARESSMHLHGGGVVVVVDAVVVDAVMVVVVVVVSAHANPFSVPLHSPTRR